MPRRTSPPSRCSSWPPASIRAIERVTRISAPWRRAWCRARLASSSPGDPGREPEVILDPRGGPGLAARRLALDDDRPQPLRGPVDPGGEARRACPDHDHVVLGRRGLGVEAEHLGDATQARPHRGLAVDHSDRRPVLGGGQRPAPLLLLTRVGRDPAEGDPVAVEETAQLRAGRVPAVAGDDRPRRRRLGGNALEAVGAADPVARQATDFLGDVRCDRGQRVVVAMLRSASPASPRPRGIRPGTPTRARSAPRRRRRPGAARRRRARRRRLT